jgi:hypothetical protein
MHSPPALVAIMLTDCHVRSRIRMGEQKKSPPRQETCGTFLRDHLPENLSETPFEVIGVKLKR